jgi:hypothetical protein
MTNNKLIVMKVRIFCGLGHLNLHTYVCTPHRLLQECDKKKEGNNWLIKPRPVTSRGFSLEKISRKCWIYNMLKYASRATYTADAALLLSC